MGLRGSVKVRGEFSLLCLVGKRNKLMEKAMPGDGIQQPLTLVRAVV